MSELSENADLTYMKSPLGVDCLLEYKVANSTIKYLPCHLAILSQASPVLARMRELIRPDRSDGKTVIPFPGDGVAARAFLAWLYDQQRRPPKSIGHLIKISHEWDIEGSLLIVPLFLQILVLGGGRMTIHSHWHTVLYDTAC